MRKTIPMFAATVGAASLALALLLTCISIGVKPAHAAAATYTLTDLGTLTGPSGGQTIARDINDAGQVAGQSQNALGQNRAFLWENGQMADLGTLGGTTSAGRGIDGSGRVVGFSRNASNQQRGFLAQRGTGGTTSMLALSTLTGFPSGEAWHINDSGVAVGRSFNNLGQGRAVLWENGQIKDLGLGTPYSEAWSINNLGQVVGEAGSVDQQAKAFLYDNRTGGVTNLDPLIDRRTVFPETYTFSEAMGINDRGQVVGWAYRSPTNDPEGEAFLYEKGTATVVPLNPSGGKPYSRARDIDESGRVVGWSRGTDGNLAEQFSATLWEDGMVMDLNELIPANSRWRPTGEGKISGWKLTDAYAINESGQIVGAGYKDGNTDQLAAFLLTPDTTVPKIECGTADDLWRGVDARIPCTASDDGVGLADPADSGFTLTTNVEAGTEMADARTGSREVCDAAGNCATAGPIGGNKVDKKAPDTTAASGSYDEGDWTNQSVTVILEASDGGSGVRGTEYDPDGAGYLAYQDGGIPVSGEGRHTIFFRSTDNTGNVESPAESFSVNIDNTSPEITGSRAPAANAEGWNNTDVTVRFACADALSGLASGCPADVVLGEGAGQSVTRSVSDEAGNGASVTVVDINIDETAPAVEVTGVTPGATYILGSVPEAGCSATDGLSGVARQATLNVTGGPLGSITATCGGALDKAGNAGSAGVTYNVNYDFDGFFGPVDNPDVLNQAKAGSAIPVKFSLGGDQGLDIFATADDGTSFPKSGPIPCNPTDPADAVEQTVTANSSGLTYDATTDLYTYVWKTRRDWTGCRQLVVRLDDRKEYTADFEFIK